MDILLLVLRLLLAGLLYAFLGAVFLFLWRDFRHATTERETVPSTSQLVVLEPTGGQTAEPAVGTAYPLRAVTSIGRALGNTVVIPDTYASSQHALLIQREGQWWLEDRNSRNGTTLNGQRVEAPIIVSSGDVIGVGRTQLRLESS